MVADPGLIGSESIAKIGGRKDVTTGTIGGNDGLSVTAGSKAVVVKSGSVAKTKEMAKFRGPSLIRRLIRKTKSLLGIDKADQHEWYERQFRECRIGMDSCTESLSDNEHH